MAKLAAYTVPTFSFRRIETPFEKTNAYRNYIAIIKTSDLPDLSEWREINVRDPKTRGHVPQKIRDSLLQDKSLFVFKNRGLVISAASVTYDNAKNLMTLRFRDKNMHGLLDGGHTYKVIQDNNPDLEHDQYVRVEILEGFDDPEDLEIAAIVEARNTSNQVKDESIMNLQGKFKGIQEAVAGQPYANLIAYSEHELLDDEGSKPVDVRELISYMMAFDRDHFDSDTHPINAYRSKVACLQHFKNNTKSFEKLYGILPDILLLWDNIHLSYPDLYNKGRSESGDVSGGRFGKLTGVHMQKGKKKIPLYFTGKKSSYSIPTGLKYPVLGAFRAFLEEKGGRYQWGTKTHPVDLLNNGLGKTLVNTVGEFALDAKNPSKTGKQMLVWKSCYQTAELEYLRSKR